MHPAPLAVMDYVGPALGALLFVAVMSLVGTNPSHPQRDHPCGRERCVLEWRLRSVGIDVPRHRRGDRVSRATVVSVYWCGLADSCVLGHRASPLGQSHLAVHAEFRVRLHDFRQLDCAVVPGRCAIVPEAPTRRDERSNAGRRGFKSRPGQLTWRTCSGWWAAWCGSVPL